MNRSAGLPANGIFATMRPVKLLAILPFALLAAACQTRAPAPPALSGPASRPVVLPDERPIWEVFEMLDCRGTTYIQCFHPRGSCEKNRSTAHILVAFRDGTVTWAESGNRQRIVGRTFRRGGTYRYGHVAPQSTIYLSEASKAIDFGGSAIEPEEQRNPGSLPATMTSTSGHTTFVHRLRCTPVP